MVLTKEQLELAALNAQPGILPKDTKFESYIGHNVINLSNVHLTEHQIRALEKGLTFCPTPNAPDKSQIWEDFKEFHRRLELMQFFKPQENQPEVNISQSIIDFMNENAKTECNESTIESDPYKEIHKNLKNKSSWKPSPPNKTLDSFKSSNPEIVIKKADKGSAIVVMQTTDYLREGYRQLSDRNFYTKLTEDPTLSIFNKICAVLTEMKNLKLITEKNFEYLQIKNPKAGRFYLLPKIHKKQVPGRPICSSIGHPTCNISKFVDAHIKEYVPQTQSYVRDTQHFISRLKQLGQIPEGALLVTLDVSSLYTNIPNHEGILAVAAHLRQDRTKDPISPYVLQLLRLVLHSMNFTFNDQHFLQTGGTAMGTALALRIYSWIGSKLGPSKAGISNLCFGYVSLMTFL